MVHYYYKDTLYAPEEFSESNFRALNFGDGIFETCLFTHTGCPLWEFHVRRIVRGVKVLKMTWPGQAACRDLEFSLKQFLTELVSIYPEAPFFRIRINLIRGGMGLYTPETSTLSWWFRGMVAREVPWPSEHRGYSIIPAPKNINPQQGALAGIKSLNSLPYVLASIYRQEQSADEVWLYNARGEIADAVSHAIFLTDQSRIITPSIHSGAVESVSAAFIKENLPLEYTFHEQIITPDQLQLCKSAFLSNAVRGIIPVTSIENRPLNTEAVQKLMKHYHAAFRKLAGMETKA